MSEFNRVDEAPRAEERSMSGAIAQALQRAPPPSSLVPPSSRRLLS